MTSESKKNTILKHSPEVPWLSGLIDHSNSVIHLPVYRRFMEVHKQLENGLAVIPDRDKHKDLLLEMAHDKAFILLPPNSLFRLVLLNRQVCRESYFGFYGLCLGRMLVDYPAPFERETIQRLHGLMDRLLFGGAQFATADEVPTIGDWFWRGLAKIRRNPLQLLDTGIMTCREYKLSEEIGDNSCAGISVSETLSANLLTASSALRNGRNRVTVEDVRDSTLALTDLFYVDVTKLDPPRRVLATVGTGR